MLAVVSPLLGVRNGLFHLFCPDPQVLWVRIRAEAHALQTRTGGGPRRPGAPYTFWQRCHADAETLEERERLGSEPQHVPSGSTSCISWAQGRWLGGCRTWPPVPVRREQRVDIFDADPEPDDWLALSP